MGRNKTHTTLFWPLVFSKKLLIFFKKLTTVNFFDVFVLKICILLLLSTQISFAQVSGTVFKDFNANGIMDASATYNEVGMPDVTITATKPDGTALAVVYTGGGTATNSTGGYTIASAVVGQTRLVFTLPSYAYASKGAIGGSTVLFPATAIQNLAVNEPDDYWDSSTDPQYVLPCYVNGSTAAGGTDPAIAAASYSFTGQSPSAGGTGPAAIKQAGVNQVGTVWGEAYQKNKQRMFFSTFLKRHCGILDGSGYIYVFDYSTATPTLAKKFDLEGATAANGGTIHFGNVTRTGSSDYTLASNKANPSVDLDAFGKVGTIAYGDIDMQPATDNLWAVNLFDQSLLKIDMSGPASALPGAVNQYILSSISGYPTSSTGILRPWGLAFHGGKGYLGVVDDASTSKVNTDLKAYVLSFDPNTIATTGFTTVLNINPNIKRTGLNQYEKFHYWMNTWTDALIASYGTYATPVLSDLEFDENGNLYLAFMDRFGHQIGQWNYKAIAGSTTTFQGISSGEILKACKTATGFSIEGSGSCLPAGSTEFFQDISGDATAESSEGATANLKGRNELLLVSVDPHPQGTTGSTYWITQGTDTYNLTDGTIKNWYTFTQGLAPDFGKANGLGDVELILPPAPIEIGNRIWNDTDNDGIQDAGEAGISGVTVTLCLASAPSTVVSTAVTDAGGNYFFSSSSTGTNTASAKYGIAIAYGTDYILKFPTTSGANSISTKPNIGANDLIDTDADGAGKITFKTASFAGQNNHSFDVGYITAPPCTPITNLVASATPSSMTTGNASALTVTGTGIVAGTTTFSWTGTGGFSAAIQAPSTGVLAAAGGYSYTVTATNADGTGVCTATATTSVNVTAAPVACTALSNVIASATPSSMTTGNASALTGTGTGIVAGTTTFSWTGTGGFSAAIQAPSTGVLATAGGYSYTVTATNADGTGVCTATATTSVNVTAAPVACTALSNVIASATPSSMTTGNASALTVTGTGIVAGTTTFSWTGTGGFSAAIQAPSTGVLATVGGYSYTVTATNANGTGVCTATATTSVNVTAAPVACTALSNVIASATPSSMTTGNASALTVTGTGIVAGTTTFSWTGTGGFSAAIQAPSTGVLASAGGYSYTVTATNADGTGVCTATATTSVNVTAAPVACTALSNLIATATPSSVTTGNAAALTVTGTGISGTTTFSWAGTGGFTSAIQAPSTGTLATPGGYSYTVTITNADGTGVCTATATTSLTVIPACTPPTGISAGISQVTCTAGVANADGKITLSGFTTEKYDLFAGDPYAGTATFATATTVPVGGVIVSNLPNPAVSQVYTIRVFNGNNCYTDLKVTLNNKNCSCPVMCEPMTTRKTKG